MKSVTSACVVDDHFLSNEVTSLSQGFVQIDAIVVNGNSQQFTLVVHWSGMAPTEFWLNNSKSYQTPVRTILKNCKKKQQLPIEVVTCYVFVHYCVSEDITLPDSVLLANTSGIACL